MQTTGLTMNAGVEGNILAKTQEDQSLEVIDAGEVIKEINEVEEDEDEKTVDIPDDQLADVVENVGHVLTEEPLQGEDLAEEERD